MAGRAAEGWVLWAAPRDHQKINGGTEHRMLIEAPKSTQNASSPRGLRELEVDCAVFAQGQKEEYARPQNRSTF